MTGGSLVNMILGCWGLKGIDRSVIHNCQIRIYAFEAPIIYLAYALVSKQLSFFGIGRALQTQNLLDEGLRAELPFEKLRFVGPFDSSSDPKTIIEIPHSEQHV